MDRYKEMDAAREVVDNARELQGVISDLGATPLTVGQLAQIANALADAKVLLEEAEDIAKARREAYEQVEATLFGAMEAANLESVRTPRGLFRLNDLAWARIADPDMARDWASTHMPELLTLNNARLSKLVRDALKGEVAIDGGVPSEAGVLLPAGVDFTTSRKITWRRS